jgi:signal transduction histidine kinase
MKQHAEETTGAWLVLGGSQEPSSTMLFSALQHSSEAHQEPEELTRAECLALASALASWRGGEPSRLRELLEDACASPDVAGGALEQWAIAACAKQEPNSRATAGSGLSVGASDGEGGMLAQLGRDLRFASLSSARSVEAEVLSGTIRLLQEHEALRRRFDERLRESRLEAVRQLAYGAGHEINNPLANIATRGQALLRDEPDPERRRKLATIVDQAFRARDMIGGLMVFAKPPAARIDRVDLVTLVESVVSTLREVAATGGVGLDVRVPDGEVAALADPHLVAEALHAVLVNACEATPQGGEVMVAVVASLRDGVHAVLVEDSGPGFGDDGRAMACDPFHCGREAGRGLGIGLSKAWSLAKACGGGLQLGFSAAGGGAVELAFSAWVDATVGP